MTLEDLRLRIEAAFPLSDVSILDATINALEAVLSEPVDLGAGSGPVVGFAVYDTFFGRAFCVRFIGDDPHLYHNPGNHPSLGSEIERRILSVTAHQLIAARRRRAIEELARLDAELIMDELPTETPA